MITLLECVRGVTYPQRGQKGYEEAITFSESTLLDTNVTFVVKKEFDEEPKGSGDFY